MTNYLIALDFGDIYRKRRSRNVKVGQSGTLDELLEMPLNEDVFERILRVLAELPCLEIKIMEPSKSSMAGFENCE
jgi:hypothetical protein